MDNLNELKQEKGPVCSKCLVLEEQMAALKKQVTLLTEQARTDALTGLFNFRHFTDALQTEMERVRRTVQPMGLIMVDIDHFKRFNDTYGHDVGNIALIHVARIVADTVRKLDVACRFGGEEFAIVLPSTPLVFANLVAERMRAAVECTSIVHKGEELHVTISLGVVVHEPTVSTSSADLLTKVDALLYQSKTQGRNCVSSAESLIPESKLKVTAAEKSALFSFGDGNPNKNKGDDT